MRSSVALCIVAVTFAVGCHGDDGHDHDHDDPDDGSQFTCLGSEDSAAAGTSKDGQSMRVVIVQATPEPHFVQNNELRVRVEDLSATPIDGVTMTVTPFTARHDHGTPITPVVSPLGTGGEYDISEINYVHRGPWLLTFDLDNTANAGTTDQVEFTFCVMDPPGVPDSGL